MPTKTKKKPPEIKASRRLGLGPEEQAVQDFLGRLGRRAWAGVAEPVGALMEPVRETGSNLEQLANQFLPRSLAEMRTDLRPDLQPWQNLGQRIQGALPAPLQEMRTDLRPDIPPWQNLGQMPQSRVQAPPQIPLATSLCPRVPAQGQPDIAAAAPPVGAAQAGGFDEELARIRAQQLKILRDQAMAGLDPARIDPRYAGVPILRDTPETLPQQTTNPAMSPQLPPMEGYATGRLARADEFTRAQRAAQLGLGARDPELLAGGAWGTLGGDIGATVAAGGNPQAGYLNWVRNNPTLPGTLNLYVPPGGPGQAPALAQSSAELARRQGVAEGMRQRAAERRGTLRSFNAPEPYSTWEALTPKIQEGIRKRQAERRIPGPTREERADLLAAKRGLPPAARMQMNLLRQIGQGGGQIGPLGVQGISPQEQLSLSQMTPEQQGDFWQKRHESDTLLKAQQYAALGQLYGGQGYGVMMPQERRQAEAKILGPTSQSLPGSLAAPGQGVAQPQSAGLSMADIQQIKAMAKSDVDFRNQLIDAGMPEENATLLAIREYGLRPNLLHQAVNRGIDLGSLGVGVPAMTPEEELRLSATAATGEPAAISREQQYRQGRTARKVAGSLGTLMSILFPPTAGVAVYRGLPKRRAK